MSTPKTTILVAEDDPGVLAVLDMALRTKGLVPLDATTGQEAIDLYRENADTIGAVLLDFQLPDMTGRTVLSPEPFSTARRFLRVP